MEIIYDKDITIKLQRNTLLPFRSTIYVESETIYYTRHLSYIEQLANKDIDLDDHDSISKLTLKDYELISHFYNAGVTKSNIGLALTLHSEDSIFKQLVKFLNSNAFSKESITNYCSEQYPHLLKKLFREVFFIENNCNPNNIFTCDFRDLLSKSTFIATGSSRATFKINDDYVIKVNLHFLGEQQSYNEAVISNHPDFKDFKDLLCVPVYTCKEYSIYERCEPLNTTATGTDFEYSDLDIVYDKTRFQKLFETLENHGISSNDCAFTHNVGISNDGVLKILDFGADMDTLELLDSEHNHALNFFYLAADFARDNNLNLPSNKLFFNEIIFDFLKECGITLN